MKASASQASIVTKGDSDVAGGASIKAARSKKVSRNLLNAAILPPLGIREWEGGGRSCEFDENLLIGFTLS